jgi:hypothetical protein
MRKRTYRAVTVKQMDMAQLGVGHDRLILGCDAAKEVWYGAWMNAQGEVLQTIRWNQVDETGELLTRLGALHAAGVVVEVAVEPTATYADAVVAQLLAQGVAVYRVNTKHSHDYQEIYDVGTTQRPPRLWPSFTSSAGGRAGGGRCRPLNAASSACASPRSIGSNRMSSER